MMSAASASPDLTLSSASARECTGIGLIAENSWLVYFVTSIDWPPRLILLADAGTWLRKATRGFCGPRESAKPISRAITIGYTINRATSSGERRRICTSLSSSQRTVEELVAALVQEGHECGLEVEVAVARADRALQVPRRAGEQQLAVGQHQHTVGVALGL